MTKEPRHYFILKEIILKNPRGVIHEASTVMTSVDDIHVVEFSFYESALKEIERLKAELAEERKCE